MFKSWLEEKRESVSWGTLLSALGAIGAADVVETVRKVYEISSGIDSEEIISDLDEIDAGFVEVCTIVTVYISRITCFKWEVPNLTRRRRETFKSWLKKSEFHGKCE